MGKRRDFSRSVVRADELALLSGALRKRVGPGRPMTAASVAGAAQVGERTFEGWLYGETAPRFGELRRLIGYMEPAFATEILAGTGRVAVDARDLQAAAVLRATPGLVAALRGVLAAVDPE